jgi:hypothetical protein
MSHCLSRRGFLSSLEALRAFAFDTEKPEMVLLNKNIFAVDGSSLAPRPSPSPTGASWR